MKLRIGHGFDIHATCPGDHVVLGGLKIPAPFSLKGHSDADALLHAITDAILGALGDEDIGHYFPPNDEVNRGRPSVDFLRFAVERAREQGYLINNIDCNVICERPKIGLYRKELCENIARLLQIAPDQVSVKGRTFEKLDAIGAEKGLAVLAVVLLRGSYDQPPSVT